LCVLCADHDLDDDMFVIVWGMRRVGWLCGGVG
jgi:hypothetical protein